MTIYIENIRKEKLACSIWNDYVGLVQAFADACKSSTEPAIIVIRCVQRCKWEGEPRVTTTRHATRFYFNHAIPEVEEFLGELYAGQEPSNSNVISYISSESEDMLSGDNLSTITEIKKCQKAGRYVTLATIYDVDLNVKWYYDSCKHCTSKVVKNDSGRYQVKFFVIGADNEVSEFVIFETQITSFINVSAADMLAALEENGRKDDMPDFDIFIDKQFIFKVEIHPKYNLEQKSKSYTVLSMSDDQDMVDRWNAKYLALKESEVGSVYHDVKPNVYVALAENKACVSETEASDSLITPPLKRSLSKMLDATNDDDCEVRIIGDGFSATKKLLAVNMEKE
ncbi:uncharacterized protein LOC141627637 [Silene latifolia]|uniref:uncharacterized protein LOC141627637 n=1 Tax=Silene latifolia TaxID=37657 RepID=UPI003D770F03